MTLEEAWNWYETSRRLLYLFGRCGRKGYWDDQPSDSRIWLDDKFKDLDSDVIKEGTAFCLAHLDDLAIVTLFSAFESIVRARFLSDVQGGRDRIEHPLISRIIAGAVKQVERGRFVQILDSYKIHDDRFVNAVGLVEEVSQVRRYRNWVAHGRRRAKPFVLEPHTAFRRLRRFLELMDAISSAS